jgi:eukaryotic-like serine/threonine-protein kinase
MNQHSDDAWLLALGAAVSDGEGVDWDSAERHAGSPDRQRLIQDLRRLSTVVDAHREVGEEPTALVRQRGPDTLAQVTHWRHLVLFERIGAGAFGMVYRGWDPVLDRDVAVKLLTPRGSGPVSPLAEARHLARVRHSNVVVVHGADEEAGTAGIWMELIEGQTLAEIIRDRGPMSGREVAGIGLDLCGALSAIHAAGLVHRDIKAQNVMREIGGRIVLMDFSGSDALPGDDGGRLLSGTPLYMAPEVLNGATPTPATDVYSLGVLLFFLLAGRLPVEGATLDDVRLAHGRGERWRLRDLRADLPDAIVQLIERATAPDVNARYRTAGELEHALMHASGAQTAAVARLAGEGAAAQRRRAWLWAGAAVLGLVTASLALVSRPAPVAAAAPMARFTVGPPFLAGSWPRISPDGRLVVYGANVEGRPRFWIHPIDQLTGYALPHGVPAETPFWSPDSAYLAYFEDGKLKRIAIDGGEPQTIADAPRPRGGDWLDNTILFARADGIYRVHPGGDGLVKVTTVDESLGDHHHGWPEILPGGRSFLYVIRSSIHPRAGVYVGSVDGGPSRRLMDPYSRVVYMDGQLLYVRDGSLVAHPFDARRALLHGEPTVLAGRIQHHAGSDATFDVSATGVLIYATVQREPSSRLVLYDRGGREMEMLTDEGWYGRPRFSPDGQRIAVEQVSPDDNNADLWVLGLSPRSAMRLTTHPAPDLHPVWSPDGRRIAFSSRRRDVWDVFVRTVDATDDEMVVLIFPGDKLVESWSPDGRFLAGTLRHSGLWVVPLSHSEQPSRVRRNELARQWQAEFSPDGRWLAYMSSESGKREVYVEPFPATGERWQVSTRGGTEPRWRGDGTELFYLDADSVVTSVRLNGSGWARSSTQALFRVEVPQTTGSNYTVSPDGSLFVVNTFVSDPVVPPIDVVVNWESLIRR